MSLLGKPSAGGGGSGLTPEQLDALVTDPELSASQAGAYQLLSLLLHGQVVSDPNNFATFTPTAVQVSSVDVKVSEVAGSVANLAAAAVPSGLTVLMTRADGQAPAGYTRVSGVFTPSGLYGQQRFMLTNFGGASASSENKVWTVVATAGASRYGDIGLGISTTIANWPGSSSNGISCVLATDENAYTLGGNGPNTGTAACYRYTVSTNAWAAIASLPAARNSALGAILADGRLLAIGGVVGGSLLIGTYTDSVYRYDPVANTWTTVASLPFRAYGGYATRLADGRVFCLFSTTTTDGSTSGGNRGAVYNPATDAWEATDTPPFAGPCYQDGSGNVVVLSLATPGNAQTYNFSAAAGARWSSTPYTAPTAASTLGAAAFTQPMAGGTVFPLGLVFGAGSQAQALFTIGTLTQAAGASFYVNKD